MLGPLTYGVLSQSTAAAPWTPASPTTSGGVSAHTWHRPGVANFQDAAKTTVAALTDPVGAVVNQGSDTHDVVQGTAANRPTLQQVTIGSVTSNVLRFDGTNDYLRGTFGGGAISQPFTMFFFAKLTAGDSNDRRLIDGDDATNNVVFQQEGGGGGSWLINAGASVQSVASYDTDNNLWCLLLNGASSQAWKNGVSVISGNAGANALDSLTLGANFLGIKNWLGDCGQVLIYPGNLSTADKNQVGGYLASATGISWTTIP
jgi:hypothetical protein